MEKKIHEQRNGEKIGTQPGWEAETHGWHRKMKLIPTELIHREPRLTKTHGDQPSLTKTHGDQPSLTKTHGDQPSLAKTHGDQPSPTKTHGDQPSLTKTHGDQLVAALLVERPWPGVDSKGPEWPGELGPSPSPWQGPLCTAAALFAVVLAYSVCRDVVQPYVTSGRSEAHRLPVLIVNRALPATAISLLAFAHLPDVLACLLRARDNDSRHRAPPSRWLARWLAARKRLWLLGAGGAALHVAYSLSYPGRLALRYKMLAWSYKQVQEGRATSWDEEDVWRMELYVSLGAMALGALSLLAIAQLPSVRDSLTGRELAYLHHPARHGPRRRSLLAQTPCPRPRNPGRGGG
ncbi:STEAP family member 1B-like [Lampetra fluviatilis]